MGKEGERSYHTIIHTYDAREGGGGKGLLKEAKRGKEGKWHPVVTRQGSVEDRRVLALGD